jgi:hypothetical protein
MRAQRSRRRSTTTLVGACAAALGCSHVPAFGQESASPPETLRIEVTGSNIRRADAAT